MIHVYVYRSGHVLVGPSTPSGAFELLAWENEAEVMTVLRWLTKTIEDTTGCLCMVVPEIVKAKSSIEAMLYAASWKKRLRRGMQDLRAHPVGKTLFAASDTIEEWSDYAIARMVAAA